MQHHSLRDRSVTGSDQTIGSFEFDDADAAGPGRNQITVMAERGNADSGLFRGLKNRHSFVPFDFFVVYSEFYGFHLPHHSFFLLPVLPSAAEHESASFVAQPDGGPVQRMPRRS